ncbi:MAG: tetratricopeptide repeat protein, partial [Planctomycetes bacterium]|nr:tetratricopeptide repeat protein [Planctomycetota bacterium]
MPRRYLIGVSALLVLNVAIPAQSSEEVNQTVDPAVRDYLSANGFLNRGLHDLAAAEYREFLAQHQDHEKAPIARYGLAVSLYHLQKFDEAASELTSLQKVTEFEFAAEVRTILGQCYLGLRRYGPAAEAFQHVAEGYRDHDLADDAAAGRAEALYLAGQYDLAVSQCRAFQSQWPRSPLGERTQFFWGLAKMAQHAYGEAADRFAGLLEGFPKGAFAEQASLLLAQCHHHNNALERAARQYRKVIKQAKSRYVPDALHGLATLLQQQGKPARAGTYLDRLLKEHPETPLAAKAQLQRGQTWFAQERFDEAFELFERVAGQDGALADDAAYWMAKCELRRGQFADSARRLE